jgi:naphthoate synthase
MLRPEAFTDVRYETDRGLAWITVDRPARLNSFRGRTLDELVAAFKLAWSDRSIGVIALTGAGDKAFCAGGDQKQRAESGDYGPSDSGLFELETLQRLIRDIPKPVIAAVNGIAVGGGHVLHVLCDLTIAAEHATFGQAGPRVGSFDAGFGTTLLARAIGEKRAREMWLLCRRYDAETALRWGLVNAVVPGAELAAAVRRWADEILALSPTALGYVKRAFNADTGGVNALSSLSFDTLHLFETTDESREGLAALLDKRSPDFARYRA